MSVMANGWGSREKSRLAVKRTLSLPKQEENSLALTNSLQSDEEMVDATSGLQVSSNPAPRRPNVRLEICLCCIEEEMLCCISPGGIFEVGYISKCMVCRHFFFLES